MVAWVDSDSLVVSSLRPLLAQADRLPEPGSARPGPRIGASYDGEWWDDVIYRRYIQAPLSLVQLINPIAPELYSDEIFSLCCFPSPLMP